VQQMKRDPAPSRAAYRMQRLWLTPGFRLLLRAGLPAALTFAACAWYFAQDSNRQDFVDRVAEIRRAVQERPEFMVRLLSVEGASPDLAAAVRGILALDLPKSSFDLDLPAMQDRIGTLDPVARADLRIKPGGILEVRITEREPAIVWRGPEALLLLDAGGRRVMALDSRSLRPDLPLIAGPGADEAVAEALRVVEAAGPIAGRLRGLVRMGERRWDVVLDRDQRILLPETEPVSALEQVIALHEAQDLLERDVKVIDMRNAARPTIRMSAAASAEMVRIKALEMGDTAQ